MNKVTSTLFTVAVGSDNPAKISPVKKVFTALYGDVNVIGRKVSSGVSEQPKTIQEIWEGAHNRAKRVLELVPEATYGVGIEGGLEQRVYGWFESSLVVIINRDDEIGIGSTGGLVLPDAFMKHIKQGKSLEDAVDETLGTHKIGRGIGMFGVVTNSYVTRSAGTEHGVAFALARFLHDDLFEVKA